jgi:hypothetical protein
VSLNHRLSGRPQRIVGGIVTGLSCLVLATSVASSQPATRQQPPKDAFTGTVQPLLEKNCYMCHGAKVSTAGLNLESYQNAATLEKDRDRWEVILNKIESGEMPPKGMPRPDPAALKQTTDWIRGEFIRQDKLIKPDPGHVTARRLNRAEYNNTVRDLLGVDFHPADDFPQDDSGYGFDNIGDVLSLSPVLMEKYVSAAEKISRMAIYGEPAAKPALFHYQPNLRRPPPPPSLFEYDETGLTLPSGFNVQHQFPADAEYLLKITLNGQRPPGSEAVTLAVWLDGKQIQQFSMEPNDMEGESRQFKTRIPKGAHLISVSFLKQFEGLPVSFKGPNPSKKPVPVSRFGGRGAAPIPPGDNEPAVGDAIAPANKGRGPALPGAAAARPPVSLAGRVDAVDIGGPFEAQPMPPTAPMQKLLACGQTDQCARKIVSELARRAYRRPLAAAEISSLMTLYSKVRTRGDSFQEGIATAIQYMLVSPDFLFQIQKVSAAARPLTGYELASRLSYFLWSSMPDDELYRVAGQGTLSNPAVLEAQVRRMLKDPKSTALVDNFAGQWLEIRNMDGVKPDWERFEQFDDLLRISAKRETQLFLSNMIQEDRSILDLIDGKYTYLNERMARFYGIPGITGPEFRKVDLTGNPQRSGIITQATVLTVSSYATRTSPVLRGKWILENILNAPPPPPPPDVPTLDVAAVGDSVSLRQQMEKHRSNAICAGCHGRMDPLGFGLENYDGIGAWRTQDGKFPIDASGKLPDGRTFTGPEGLKTVVMSSRDAFAGCVTEKLLTYALGRGLERYDKPVVAEIVRRAQAGNYRFSGIVLGIVRSMPFQMLRGDQKADVRHS